jgi:hypothetical protein
MAEPMPLHTSFASILFEVWSLKFDSLSEQRKLDRDETLCDMIPKKPIEGSSTV